jgi:hypothetical protein
MHETDHIAIFISFHYTLIIIKSYSSINACVQHILNLLCMANSDSLFLINYPAITRTKINITIK